MLARFLIGCFTIATKRLCRVLTQRSAFCSKLFSRPTRGTNALRSTALADSVPHGAFCRRPCITLIALSPGTLLPVLLLLRTLPPSSVFHWIRACRTVEDFLPFLSRPFLYIKDLKAQRCVCSFHQATPHVSHAFIHFKYQLWERKKGDSIPCNVSYVPPNFVYASSILPSPKLSLNTSFNSHDVFSGKSYSFKSKRG